MNLNPMQLLGMVVQGNNPRNLILGMLKQNNNPGMSNLYNMIQNNDEQGIEQMARNLAKEKGIDIDAMKNNMLNNLR